MTDTNPRMTDAEAIQVLRDIADEFEFRSYYKEVVTALAHIEALRARVEAARYFASGPVGSFWTNEHQVAHELICGHPLLCRDDWTITDLHEAARTNTQGREA